MIALDSIVEFENDFYFYVLNGGYTASIMYRSDGSPNGTQLFRLPDALPKFKVGDSLLYTYSCYSECSAEERFTFQLKSWNGEADSVLFEAPKRNSDPDRDFSASLIMLGSDIFFVGEQNLYRTDGTVEGTIVVDSGVIGPLVGATSNQIYFWIDHAGERRLAVTDGTVAGKTIVEDDRIISPARYEFVVWNDSLLGIGNNGREHELVRVDGAVVTTLFEYDATPERGFYFIASHDASGITAIRTHSRLFVSDGTSAGTESVRLPFSRCGPESDQFLHTQGRLYYVNCGAFPRETAKLYRFVDFQLEWIASDVEFARALDDRILYWNRGALWQFRDGHTEPMLFADEIGIEPTEPHLLLEDGSILFSAMDHGEMKFWTSDGTQQGTSVLSTYPVEATSDVERSSQFENFHEIEGKIVFQSDYGLSVEGGNHIYSMQSPAGLTQGSDLDRSGVVDFGDFLILASNFGQEDAFPNQGDINLDGKVDFVDYLLLAQNFGKSPT